MDLLNIGWLLILPLVWFIWKKKKLEQELMQASLKVAQLEGEKKLFVDTKGKFEEIFKLFSLEAVDVLRQKSDQEMHKVLHPVKESLTKLDANMRAIERERKGETEVLKSLREETANLAKALRKPD